MEKRKLPAQITAYCSLTSLTDQPMINKDYRLAEHKADSTILSDKPICRFLPSMEHKRRSSTTFQAGEILVMNEVLVLDS